MKKIVFIYNPISGVSGKRMILSQIDSRLDRTLFTYEIKKTEYAGHATLLARQAVEDGADVVCAVGGDGTMNEVARALINTDAALAIIPCGSGNGLARHLHIPLDPIRAIELINDCTVRTMDYGMINSHPFFCTCGVGFDAFISSKFAASKFRGPIAYLENILANGLKYNPETYEIDVVTDKEEHASLKAFLIACANASQYGNNVYIAPQASVRDGLLDVTIIKPFTVIESPQLAIQMMNGTVGNNNLFSTFKCRSLTIHRQGSGVIHYDGDPVDSDADVEISVVPKGLRCICPDSEGMMDVAENIQNTFIEQIRFMQMRSEELIKMNRRTTRKLREHTKATNRKLIDQTKATNLKLLEQTKKLMKKIQANS